MRYFKKLALFHTFPFSHFQRPVINLGLLYNFSKKEYFSHSVAVFFVKTFIRDRVVEKKIKTNLQRFKKKVMGKTKLL